MNESDSFASGYIVGRDSGNGGNGNGNNGWGDGSAWWIVILFLFVFCGWGNGWNNGSNGNGGGSGSGSMMTGYDFGKLATTNDVASGFATSAELNSLNDIKLGQSSIQQTMCQGFNGINTSILQSSNGTNAAIMQSANGLERQLAQLGYQQSQCCCDTERAIDGVQRSIDGVNYNMSKNVCDLQNTLCNTTRDIIDSQRQGTDAILNFLTTEKVSTLQAENARLANQLSQVTQTNTIINTLRPTPIPAYQTCSPFQSIYGCPNAPQPQSAAHGF